MIDLKDKYPPVEDIPNLFTVSDGELFWKERSGPDSKRFNTRYAGKVAGTVNKFGYRVVTLRYRTQLMVHRILFAFYYGYYPETVDHVDRNKLNNTKENLRAANWSNQQANKGNWGKYKRGVTFQGGRKKPYYAAIRVDGKLKHLGTFLTEDEAHSAFLEAHSNLHGEFSTGGYGHH